MTDGPIKAYICNGINVIDVPIQNYVHPSYILEIPYLIWSQIYYYVFNFFNCSPAIARLFNTV